MRNFSIIYNKRNNRYLAVYDSPFTDKTRTRVIHSLLSSSDIRSSVIDIGTQLINLDNVSSDFILGDIGNFSYYDRDNYLSLYSLVISCDSAILKRLYKLIFAESIYFIKERNSLSVMEDVSSLTVKDNCIACVTSNNVSSYLDDMIYVDIGDIYDRSRKILSGYNISSVDNDKFVLLNSYYTLDMMKDLIECNIIRVVDYYKSLGNNYRNSDLGTVRNLLLSSGFINLTNCFDKYLDNDTVIHDIVTNIHEGFVALGDYYGSSVFNRGEKFLFSKHKFNNSREFISYNITVIIQKIINCVNNIKQLYLKIALRSLFKLPFNVTVLLNVGVPIVVDNANMLNDIKLYRVIDVSVSIDCRYSKLLGYDSFNEFMSILYSKYGSLISLVSSLNILGDVDYKLERSSKFTLLPLGEFTGKHLELLDYGNLLNLRRCTEIQYFTDLNYINDWCLYTYFKFLYRNGLAKKICLVFIDNNNLTVDEVNTKIDLKLTELQNKLVEQFDITNINTKNIKYKVWESSGKLISEKSNTRPASLISDSKYFYSKSELIKDVEDSIGICISVLKDKLATLDDKLLQVLLNNIILNSCSCSIEDTNFGIVSPIYGTSDALKVTISRFINFKFKSCEMDVKEVESILYKISEKLDVELYKLVIDKLTAIVELYHKPNSAEFLNLMLEVYSVDNIIYLLSDIISKVTVIKLI